MQAMQAPMYFAATGSMRKLLLEVGCSRLVKAGDRVSDPGEWRR
jgi:hypothetical protein